MSRRIRDNDPERGQPAIFICGRCTHAHDAPENDPPTYCKECGAHIGLHVLRAGNVNTDPDLVENTQELVRTGKHVEELHRRQRN